MNKTSERTVVKNLTASAICLALCLVLPLLTGQIPHFGMALAPMHIPVLLCGFVTGPLHAMIIGFLAPLLRTILFGMPEPFMAITMCFELAAYGLFAGVFYKVFPKKAGYIYLTLILSMLCGRIVWGLITWQLAATTLATSIFPKLPYGWEQFGWTEFMTSAFVSALPGIVLHIILIPILVITLRKAKSIE